MVRTLCGDGEPLIQEVLEIMKNREYQKALWNQNSSEELSDLQHILS